MSIPFKLLTWLAGVVVLYSPASFAGRQICLLNDTYCVNTGVSSTRQSAAASSKMRVNPSAVPTDDAFGIEMIAFKDQVDVGLAKGTGRIGAAISPSNSEETFFGPPGLELPTETHERKYNALKYPNQKVTLATAFNLWDNERNDLRRVSINIGVMGKYNRKTKGGTAGGGLNLILGPFALGASAYEDEYQYNVDLDPPLIERYQVQTYNIGLYLGSLILDYSFLTVPGDDPSKIDLYTASVLVKKWILSLSGRYEDSPRLKYNYDFEALEYRRTSEEYFGGVQYRIHKNLVLGGLYNYYLLREISLTGTLFF